ncbi:MAG: hypothetical protein WDM89_01240 [Rhizomicrobium sp.]
MIGDAAGMAAVAAVGDAAGQGVGLAAGIIKSFNWAEVGMSALTAGIGKGLGESGVFGDLGIDGTGFVDRAAQGAMTNAVTQGVGVATGLQKSFNWAGVAAAGVGAGRDRRGG